MERGSLEYKEAHARHTHALWQQAYSAVATIKLEAGCTDCGFKTDVPDVYDFDHVRGTKEFEIGAALNSKGFSRVVDELEKCDVVCANCHRIRTRTRKA